MSKLVVNSENAPAPVGAYNQSIQAAGLLFISGQIAIHPESGNLVTSSIEEETHQVMKNIAAILEANNLDFDNVVKCSVFVSDINNFTRINDVYSLYFDAKNAPARELVEVANLPKFVNVEISTIAIL